ncbi:putative prophage phiRv2 integrase [Terrabacter tumescens]|uniref:Prophage phiRv2 integrase n=2 Tax=Terrabacter tumescens TaxID=60443 RepID=A0ABQ2IGT9_9MICO|nr:putative prophage phiRv2 integrase [Terrabacter tumescens]
MAGKRVRGSFRRLPSGRWQVRYTGPDGLRRAMNETYRTKADAEAAWSVLAGQIVTGRWTNPERARVTFSVYAYRWVGERAGLSPRTRELYTALLRLHVTPALGKIQMRHLGPEEIRQWRQARLDDGVGPSTVAKAYRLVSAICSTAVDDDLMHRNPCRIKGAGAESAPERPVLTLREVLALAEAITPRYRLLVLLAVFASLRWGELLGLTKADLDLDSMTVHVRRSVSEVGGRLVVKPPKSAAGRRDIAIPHVLKGEIERHLDAYAEPGPAGRVFTGAKGATPRRAHFVSIWRAAKTKAGVPESVHLHDLRHTGNHLAASSGASTRELMSRMGHASMRAAIIYQHATAKRDRAIAEAMDRLFELPEDEDEDEAEPAQGPEPGEASA